MTDWSSSWVVLQWAAAALAAALVLPHVLRGSRRSTGTAVQLTLGLAVGLALAAVAAANAEHGAPVRLLHLGGILALVCGLIGLAGMLIFDLVLPAARIDMPSVLRDVVLLVVAGVAVMICLRLAGLDVLPLITTSAVLTAVVGLALQTTLANVFGGLALHLDRTLGHGDWIRAGAHSGRIVEIGWRATQLVTKDGDTLFLPNSQLVSGDVLNFSRPTGAHRTAVRLAYHERHPPGTVRPLLVDAVRDVPGVLAHPPPDCVIADVADNGIVYEVRYWMTEFERDAEIESDVRARLWYASRRAGLEGPPPRAVTMRSAAETAAAAPAQGEPDGLRLLRRVDLFASLGEDCLVRLASAMRRLDFTAGEAIVHQGDIGDSLYVVQRGHVGVRVQVGGSTAEVATLGPGEVFGEMSVLTGAPRTATCVARTEVSCWIICRGDFEPLLAERPALAEQLSARLATRQMELEAQRDGLSSLVRSRREAEHRSRLLSSIRHLFGLNA